MPIRTTLPFVSLLLPATCASQQVTYEFLDYDEPITAGWQPSGSQGACAYPGHRRNNVGFSVFNLASANS